MELGELMVIMLFFIMAAAACGALCLFLWWLWRKMTLPKDAPPPKLSDLSALKNSRGKVSIVVRLVVVAGMTILMSAPVGMINDLIWERSCSYNSVVKELSHSWGGQQLLIGPILIVPYTISYNVIEKVPLTEAEISKLKLKNRPTGPMTKDVVKTVTSRKKAVLLPKDLQIEGTLEPELRRRGIYSVRVFTAGLSLRGAFRRPDFKLLDKRASEVHWDQAKLLVNLSDTKAFRNISQLSIEGAKYDFVPGTNGSPMAPTGFSADAALNAATTEDIPFSFDMGVGGSQGFFIAPIGESNNIKVSSPWPHPKYWGDGLPTTRTQGESGFSAEWEVPNLVRNYPQFADLEEMAKVAAQGNSDRFQDNLPPRANLRLAEYIIGVDLFEPVFHYSILTRAVKYAMMFIALTFLSVLIFEIAAGRRGEAKLHLAQYGIIGLGLCLFYLVLLAASEQMPFIRAYILAASINIAMIAGYVRAALRQNRPALAAGGILTALYSALFFILRMEEYSLACGTALMVLALIALMHVTRNMGRASNEDETEGENSDSGGKDIIDLTEQI